LDISSNHIAGQLPANISSVFPGLHIIDVSNNNFSGEIPISLCHINQIDSIHLSNNIFSGEMPACLFTDLPNLSILRVSNNHLSGPIFGGRSNLSSMLSIIQLDGNKFAGALPRNLSGEELRIMDLHDNKLTGELDASSWNHSLFFLVVSDNYMSGEMQPLLCALPNIVYLDISNNHFTGRIRSCNNTLLMTLDVSMNLLSGDVSWEHFNMSNLAILEASHNMLTGNLSWAHRLPLIKVLSLGHNEFLGQIPPGLCKLKYLWIIDLSHNDLSGWAPPCIGDISFQDILELPILNENVFIHLYQYNEVYIQGMQLRYGPFFQRMSGIDLSENLLAEEIPQELSHVRSLNLSGNAFVGQIPASLSNMSEVESLDLSHNELTGVIPPELTRLQYPEWFSVAYNHLSGCVPSSDQFSTFGEDSYKNNSQLDVKCSSSPPGLEPGPIPARDETVVDAVQAPTPSALHRSC
jgi:Leucine-rich repeat (LRR) protein